MDHFNITTPDVQAAYEYYSSLGFGLSETIEDGQTLYAAWMYRKQTVHDVAFTGGAGPRLHQLGFFAHESHHVLRICDILGSLREDGHIERGPGRHGVSNTDPRRRDFWGHAVIPSWYTEATIMLDLDGDARQVTQQRQTAEYAVGADGFPVSR